MASGTDSTEETLSYQPGSNRLFEVNATELPNRATQSQQSWGYNQANRMTAYLRDGAIITDYIVNSQGQRSHKIDTQTDAQTIYQYGLAGYQIISESTTDATSNTTGKDYIWLDGEPVAQIDNSNGTETISYLHTDHLLTARLATDSAGQIIWRWEGEAFGDVQPQELTTININLRFPGQYYDKESGLFYNMFRDYNPATGRYVQSDLIGLDGGLNNYKYSNSNTLRYFDKDGKQAFERNTSESTKQSTCAYYAAVGSRFGCKYHKFAYQACLGDNTAVTALTFGVSKEKVSCIRRCLIRSDKISRRNNACRISAMGQCDQEQKECTKKVCIDDYHISCFTSCGVSSYRYGGRYGGFINDG